MFFLYLLLLFTTTFVLGREIKEDELGNLSAGSWFLLIGILLLIIVFFTLVFGTELGWYITFCIYSIEFAVSYLLSMLIELLLPINYKNGREKIFDIICGFIIVVSSVLILIEVFTL